MSFKKNIIISYAAQIYVSAVGILILPLYIKYMGAEAYGLIGFFTMLQALFNLLDMGLTPTIGRETARYHGGSINSLDYRRLLRALNIIFIIIAIFGCVLIISLSDVIAARWLHVKTLSISEVKQCIEIMSICVALRWMGGLYRGILIGSEKLDRLGIFNIIITTLRFIGVFIAMKIYGFTPDVFFYYQGGVAIIEFSILYILGSNLIPPSKNIGWSFKPVKPLLKFSLMIAFTSSVWVCITQSDKLILSGLLSLSDYGHYTLAVLVASGIVLLNGPVSSALLPRLARLYAEGGINKLIFLYDKTTMLVSTVAGSASVVIAFWAKELVYIWTGDLTLSAQVAPILTLYSIGNGLLVVSAFPYYLQYAIGNLKLHFIGNCIMLIILLPSVVYLSIKFGGIGAGIAWVTSNAFYLFVWCAYSHRKIIPGKHIRWLFFNVAIVYLLAVMINLIISILNLSKLTRIEMTGALFAISMLTLIVASIPILIYSKKNNEYEHKAI